MYTFETVVKDIMEAEGIDYMIPDGFYGMLFLNKVRVSNSTLMKVYTSMTPESLNVH